MTTIMREFGDIYTEERPDGIYVKRKMRNGTFKTLSGPFVGIKYMCRPGIFWGKKKENGEYYLYDVYGHKYFQNIFENIDGKRWLTFHVIAKMLSARSFIKFKENLLLSRFEIIRLLF